MFRWHGIIDMFWRKAELVVGPKWSTPVQVKLAVKVFEDASTYWKSRGVFQLPGFIAAILAAWAILTWRIFDVATSINSGDVRWPEWLIKCISAMQIYLEKCTRSINLLNSRFWTMNMGSHVQSGCQVRLFEVWKTGRWREGLGH